MNGVFEGITKNELFKLVSLKRKSVFDLDLEFISEFEHKINDLLKIESCNGQTFLFPWVQPLKLTISAQNPINPDQKSKSRSIS